MIRVREYAAVVVAASFFLGGCATAPSYEDAFSSGQQVHGSMESIAAPMDKTWAEAMSLLAQQGFIVQQADEKSHIILMERELRDQKNTDFSYTITATLTFVPMSDQITRVMVAANQSTELHRKEYVWWHLLWILPIFPVGSNYTTVVVNRDTVRSPQFYHDFFDSLEKSVVEAKEEDSVPAAPVNAAPPAAPKPAAPAVSAVAAKAVPASGPIAAAPSDKSASAPAPQPVQSAAPGLSAK